MKWFVTITAFAASITSASILKDSSKEHKNGDRYFYFPGDGDDTLHLVDTEAPIDEVFLEEYSRDPANNAYWLYTRSNPTIAQVLVPNNVDNIKDANFSFVKDIVVLVHGWNGDGENTMNKMLTEAFLQDNDVNVLVLDWNRLANKNYVTAKRGTPAVGKALGEFINWMVSLGASYERMHLIGFSLGAHLVGCSGRETKAKIKRITALDPAGPLWSNDNDRITSEDAQYVEVIHTNSFLYGISETCGDADFFPNGGSNMPGCWLNTCSHSRAYEYMAASVIYNNFLANECNDMNDMTKNNCCGPLNSMGNSNLLKTRSGIFRVNTGKYYPF